MSRRGSILMIGMWVMAILAVFAVGMGHRAAVNLKLARSQRDRLKAHYFACAGINKAVIEAREDAIANNFDTLQECGVSLNTREAKDIFSRDWSKDEGFSVGYFDAGKVFRYGMSDEESKANINIPLDPANNFESYKLSALLESKGISGAAATELSKAMLGWIDPNSAAETDKKTGFSAPEELLLMLENFYKVKGYSGEGAASEARSTYQRLDGMITVYGDNKINLNTAPKEVLRIITIAEARCISDTPQNIQAAETLVQKLAGLAASGPLKEMSQVIVDSPTPEEAAILAKLIQNHLKLDSGFLRIESTGSAGGVKRTITAVYDRAGKAYYWREN